MRGSAFCEKVLADSWSPARPSCRTADLCNVPLPFSDSGMRASLSRHPQRDKWKIHGPSSPRCWCEQSEADNNNGITLWNLALNGILAQRAGRQRPSVHGADTNGHTDSFAWGSFESQFIKRHGGAGVFNSLFLSQFFDCEGGEIHFKSNTLHLCLQPAARG